ncbi:hypothetical protein CA13_50060 [Planctomycetes bacterium CA13]|uniref:Uncharacterized protein n=1 Tax=Novipirellula herctigrandis TaxID=2527986 RepID=A0A5C5Z8L1_9BACT|nr:hypothetical protein CA13_50060 [Planctomycetes bacterium CA13]
MAFSPRINSLQDFVFCRFFSCFPCLLTELTPTLRWLERVSLLFRIRDPGIRDRRCLAALELQVLALLMRRVEPGKDRAPSTKGRHPGKGTRQIFRTNDAGLCQVSLGGKVHLRAPIHAQCAPPNLLISLRRHSRPGRGHWEHGRRRFRSGLVR